MIRGILLSLIFTTQAFASPFLNMREGNSFYVGNSELEKVEEVYERIGMLPLHASFEEVLKGRTALCAESILTSLEDKYPSEEQSDLTLTLRHSNKIDDIAYSIINKSLNLDYKSPIPVSKGTTNKLKEKEEILKAYEAYLKRAGKKECGVDNYQTLAANLRKYAEKFNKRFLKKANYLALHKKVITKDQFRTLEKYRQGKVYEWSMTLKTYAKKIKGIRTQFPIEGDERSDFVTEKKSKTKQSRRQALFEKYTYYQIILMGDVIKKMRKRLDASRIDIVIYDENGDEMEVIHLSPMERFRFILKLLRKEMDTLAHNSFFNGVKPSYVEIITAAYELGVIPAEELSETAKLEEIWNPSKSRWDKIVFWIKTFGGISAVLIPPPWGFVSVLAIMALEATTTKTDGRDEDINLF